MDKKREKPLVKWLIGAVFVIYFYFLMKLILFKMGPIEFGYLLDQFKRALHDPESISRSLTYMGNLVPFKEISENLHSILNEGNMISFINFAGNIVAFVPLGFMLPILFQNKMSWLKIVSISFLLSTFFEVTQLVLFIGTFDVDDILLNTTGGIIGYLLFKLGVHSIHYFAAHTTVWNKDQLKSKVS